MSTSAAQAEYADTPAHQVVSRLHAAASVLFFLSGATGLIYEVIWYKRFAFVWGSSSLAMASVVASFLLGLGIGALAMGKIIDRCGSPMLWYGVSEIVIGLLVLLIPMETAWLVGVASHLYAPLQHLYVVSFLIRCLLTFAILGPTCILMGGTLPLLVKELTKYGPALGRSTSWLYAVNTLGAALGCYLAGFHLLPMIGLTTTNTATAFVNLIIGSIAIFVFSRASWKVRPIPSFDREDLTIADGVGEKSSARSLYLVSFLFGAAALISQVVWTRQLALLLGGSTYAFTAVLVVVLLGIGFGSLVFHRWLSGSKNLLEVAAVTTALFTISALMGAGIVLPRMVPIVGALIEVRASALYNGLICVGNAALIELVPAICMGIHFPLVVELTRQKAPNAGRTVGTLYLCNTLGTLFAACFTSVVLIVAAGTYGALVVAVSLSFVGTLILVRTDKRCFRQFAMLSVVILPMCFVFAPRDPRLLNSGVYIYGERQDADLLFFHEGRSVNVTVTENEGNRALRVNGKVDASDRGDMETQLGCAYFPRFLRPDCRNVLVIGFGSGTTPGASLLFPDTKVTCCELEPAVITASRYFHRVNHRPEASPRFSLVFDDGRAFVHGTDERFDLIISEPSNPWIAGISNLYTQEYFEIAKDKLSSEGMYAQWIQCYAFAPADYAAIVETVQSVFPHYALVRITGADTILLASRAPIPCSLEAANRSQLLVDANSLIASDLERYFGTTDIRSLLLSHLVLGPDELARFAAKYGHGEPIRDRNLRLEFDAPLRLFGGRYHPRHVERALFESASIAWSRQCFEQWDCSNLHLQALETLAALSLEVGRPDLTQMLAKYGLSLDPERTQLITAYLRSHVSDDPQELATFVHRLLAKSSVEAQKLGVGLAEQGRYRDAVTVFEAVAANHPNSAQSWANLATNYQALGDKEHAWEALQKALSLDPLNNSALDSMSIINSSQ